MCVFFCPLPHEIRLSVFRGLVIVRSINPRPHYQPQSFSPRADNGLGLILRAITKTLCYNLFITYSISLFQRVWRKKNVSKTEEWRNFALCHATVYI